MTALEYMSSVAMERMFGARWWDDTDKPLNIDGRVCLYGFLAFGFMCTVVVSFLSPSLIPLIDALPRDIVSTASSCIISLMAIDLLKSATALTNLSGKMSDAAIAETMERIGETSDDRETMDENVEELGQRLEARKRARLSTREAGRDTSSRYTSKQVERANAKISRASGPHRFPMRCSDENGGTGRKDDLPAIL